MGSAQGRPRPRLSPCPDRRIEMPPMLDISGGEKHLRDVLHGNDSIVMMIAPCEPYPIMCRAYAKDWTQVLKKKVPLSKFVGIVELGSLPIILRRNAVRWLRKRVSVADGDLLLFDHDGHFRAVYASRPDSVLVLVIGQNGELYHRERYTAPVPGQVSQVIAAVQSARLLASTAYRPRNKQIFPD